MFLVDQCSNVMQKPRFAAYTTMTGSTFLVAFLGGFSFVGGTSSHSDPTLIHTKNWIHVIQVAGMVRCCQAFSVLSAAWSTWKASTFDAGAARIRGSTPFRPFLGTRISPGKLMELWVIWWTTFGVKCTHGLTKNGLYICIWLFLVRYCKTCFLEELVLAVQVAMRTTTVTGFPT